MAHCVNRTSHDLVECRALHGALSRLEPCAVKVACTVLRGRGGGNATSLPDSSHCGRWGAPQYRAVLRPQDGRATNRLSPSAGRKGDCDASRFASRAWRHSDRARLIPQRAVLLHDGAIPLPVEPQRLLDPVVCRVSGQFVDHVEKRLTASRGLPQMVARVPHSSPVRAKDRP